MPYLHKNTIELLMKISTSSAILIVIIFEVFLQHLAGV